MRILYCDTRIDHTAFGEITIDGKTYDHDVIVRLSGEIVKRKKKLSKKLYGTRILCRRTRQNSFLKRDADNSSLVRAKTEEDFVKTVKRKAKSAALVWKEFGLTAGYHSHTAPAAKGSYCITPTFEREVFNGYLVSQVDDCAGINSH